MPAQDPIHFLNFHVIHISNLPLLLEQSIHRKHAKGSHGVDNYQRTNETFPNMRKR
jgi:hypothetical protein